MLLVSAGLLWMTAVSPTSSWTALIPGFMLQGAGIGLVNPPLASAAIGVVPPARSGMASGANNTARQVGIATGIAALGAVFQHDIARGTLVHHAYRVAFTGALTNILEIASAIAFMGAVAGFALVRSKDFVASHAPAAPEAAIEVIPASAELQRG
jgi:MFS family permease